MNKKQFNKFLNELKEGAIKDINGNKLYKETTKIQDINHTSYYYNNKLVSKKVLKIILEEELNI